MEGGILKRVSLDENQGICKPMILYDASLENAFPFLLQILKDTYFLLLRTCPPSPNQLQSIFKCRSYSNFLPILST